MDQLNDDCVCHILEYLALVDQIKMSRLSERFRDLLCLIVWRKPRYRNVSVSDTMLEPLSKADYIYFFELTSEAMEELYVWNVYNKAFDSYLGRHLLRPELAFYLSRDFGNLRKLCIADASMNNSMIHTVAKNCIKLTSLSVSSPYITGKHMIGFTKLDTLVARECSIEPNFLEELLDQRKLTYLDLTSNRHDVEEVILKTSGSKHLQRLGLSNAQDYGFHLAQQLSQLTTLVVSYHDIEPDQQLEMLERTRKLVENSNCKKFPQRLQSILCNVVDVEVALELISGLETRQPREAPKYSELLKIMYYLSKPEMIA
ncbi:uncharacterized protein Dwil_GK19030 [Drosophila willistoni]|uniref:F-box domain-containing protein n=1 Tax=Drosophila willistoni TaxID=7260 RepID=B4MUJ7_DROWI|nr:uncharacterized protein LOC6642847 [Drosophila willistoni]EDW76192.1 uncharacterized protein Dwil_GK19030 [Drosophila willistoni]